MIKCVANLIFTQENENFFSNMASGVWWYEFLETSKKYMKVQLNGVFYTRKQLMYILNKKFIKKTFFSLMLFKF